MDPLKPNPEVYNVPWTTDSFNGMPYRWIGRSGLRASAIGLGTWKFGFPETGDGSRVDQATAFQIFDNAIQVGVTFWDTANRYNASSGNSERVIGQWLAHNPDQRRNIVLATKLFGGMDGVTPNHSRLSRLQILEAVYASLERLQADSIDLLYFHRYDPLIPAEESLAAVEDLVRQDLIRYFGVSNFSVDQIKQYRAMEKDLSSRCRTIVVQNQYDILHGESEPYSGVLEQTSELGFSFIAWSPLARGLLTERYLDLSSVGEGDRLVDEGTLEQDTQDVIMTRVRRLAELAHEADLQLNQLAIAYMLSMPSMGSVIAGCSSTQQLLSNAGAAKVTLSQDQIAHIESILGNH